jgi:hypothetical protein
VAERRLRIDRLVIRTRGISEPDARALASGLGEAVLRQLSESRQFTQQPPGTHHVERVDAGVMPASRRDQVASHLAGAVLSHLLPVDGD